MVWPSLSVLLIGAPFSLLGLVFFYFPWAWISAHGPLACFLVCRLWLIYCWLGFVHGVYFGPNFVLCLKRSLLPPFSTCC